MESEKLECKACGGTRFACFDEDDNQLLIPREGAVIRCADCGEELKGALVKKAPERVN